MAELTINGPVVKSDLHNAVLRDALFHSPVERFVVSGSYHLIEVGIREGSYTTWIGSWDGSKQHVAAGTPVSVLDTDRLGMRLKADQAIVVRVTSTGTPTTLKGSRVHFRLGLVGGRDGPAKPLVASGGSTTDPNARVALRVLERQINTGGLAEWEDGVALDDPVGQMTAGTFQGRLQVDSTTQISLQRYGGNWVEVDGKAVDIGSSGIVVTTAEGLLSTAGGQTTTAPSASTLYCVYLSTAGLRLCATTPTRRDGVYYLGSQSDVATKAWRFVGWAYTNGSTQFTDSVTARHVINYYHRRPLRLYTCPAYSDNNAATAYTQASSNWAKLNGGTGSDVSFVANGEDPVPFKAKLVAVNTTSCTQGCAVGIDGATDLDHAGVISTLAGVWVHESVERVYAPTSAGLHTASILGRQSSGTSTIYADVARNGAAADPATTYLIGWVMG